MFRPRVIPCLLLKNLGLVKTINFDSPKYIGDPMNAVRLFNDFEADELVFLDIGASKDGRTIPLDFVKKVGEEAFMPFAVGGGIRNIEDAKKILNGGAEKIVLNSGAIENPGFVKSAVEIFGGQAIVISIDAKKYGDGKYKVFTLGGTKEIDKDPVSVAKDMASLGIGEIIINSIDNDGRMNGYDLDLIKLISKSVEVPIIALGGAGEIEDLLDAIVKGAHAVAAGSIFVYGGKEKGVLINYPDKEELKEIFRDS